MNTTNDALCCAVNNIHSRRHRWLTHCCVYKQSYTVTITNLLTSRITPVHTSFTDERAVLAARKIIPFAMVLLFLINKHFHAVWVATWLTIVPVDVRVIVWAITPAKHIIQDTVNFQTYPEMEPSLQCKRLYKGIFFSRWYWYQMPLFRDTFVLSVLPGFVWLFGRIQLVALVIE